MAYTSEDRGEDIIVMFYKKAYIRIRKTTTRLPEFAEGWAELEPHEYVLKPGMWLELRIGGEESDEWNAPLDADNRSL